MAYPKPIDLNKFNKPKPSNIPLVAQQAIAAAHTGGSIPPMPAAKPAPQTTVQDPYAKAGFTSKEHYANSQQNRYNDAVTVGNNDLIGRLEADALNKGYTLAKPAMPKPQPAPAPAGGSVAPPMPAMPNYNDIAEAEQARYLAERQRIADQQKSGLTRAFDRSNEILGENRTLEDARISRTLNPFSGRTSYAKGLTERERTLADEAAQGNFNAAIQGVEQGLANDRNTAAQEIMARAYELEQDAKRYGLDYAQVFGQGPNGGPQTLAAQNADRGYALDLAGLSGQLPGGGQTLAARNQAYQQMADARDFDYQAGRDARGDLVDDRNFNRGVKESDRDFNFRKVQQEWENNFNQGQFDFNKAQTLWERAFSGRKFDQDMKEAAASRGLQWANLDQRQKEFIADQEFREKQFEFDQKKYNDSNSGSNSGLSEELTGELEGLFTGLSTNQISPNQAIDEIDNRLRMGLETPENATTMKSFIQKYIEGSSSPKPQVPQESSLVGLTPEGLLKAWETDPTGKAAGRAKYDWRSWIMDPKGYRAGMTYELWHDLYGPKLGG